MVSCAPPLAVDPATAACRVQPRLAPELHRIARSVLISIRQRASIEMLSPRWVMSRVLPRSGRVDSGERRGEGEPVLDRRSPSHAEALYVC